MTLHGEASEYGRWGYLQERKYFDLYHFGQLQPGQCGHTVGTFPGAQRYLDRASLYPQDLQWQEQDVLRLCSGEIRREKQAKQQAYTVPDACYAGGKFQLRGKPSAARSPISSTIR